MSRKTKKRDGAQKPSRFVWLTGLIGGGLVLVWVLWGLAQPSPATTVPVEVQGAPKLKVDQAKIDLGNVKLGQTVSASFMVSNVGDQPLQFSEAPYIEVIEGCCPPEPVIGSMMLNPGETTTISMQFMMHGDMGGPHNYGVHMLTNDPATPNMTANVISNWVP